MCECVYGAAIFGDGHICYAGGIVFRESVVSPSPDGIKRDREFIPMWLKSLRDRTADGGLLTGDGKN